MTEGFNVFSLEYNETTQLFHVVYAHQRKEPTANWHTVIESCTDDEYHIFMAYINGGYRRKLSLNYVLQSLRQLKGFMDRLDEYKLEIRKME